MSDLTLNEQLIQLISNAHRFAKTASTFGTDRHPRAWLRALSLMDEHGEMRVSDFARMDQCSQPSATALLRKLAERGYVERSTDPDDARAIRVSVTDRGRSFLADGRNEIAEALVPRFADVEPSQIAKLSEGLNELRAIVRASDPVRTSGNDQHQKGSRAQA
ncbi:DNA-binding MarR family transcriptional regulator [Rhodococcus sp. 27YEA15]|uniref:MarR family winged helix-turn-helix transcriptional regulator n=1 Tax=Rhodococcus sp. 27YEA15 TaxID=3156259 RepID=UPI003C7E4D45